MLISTGVPQLDKMIDGGLKTNYCYAIKGPAGIGKTVLSLFIADGALNQHVPVIYITTEVAPEEILNYAKSFSLNFNKYIKNNLLKITRMRLIPKGEITIQSEKFDLTGIISRTKNYIKTYNAKVVIFDSISAFFAEFKHEEAVRRRFLDFIEEIKKQDVALILTSEMKRKGELISLEEFLVDGVIYLEGRWEDKTLNKIIRVPKLRGARPTPYENIFLITPRGIKIMLPEQLPIVQLEGESTGIKKLDELLGNGVPKGSMVLVETTGETDYMPLVVTTLVHYAKENKGIIIHSNVQMYPNRIISELKKVQCDIEEYIENGNIVFIDKYNRSVTAIEAKEIRNMMNIEHMLSITGELMSAFEANNQEMVLYGDLTDDINILPEREFLKYFSLQAFYLKDRLAIGYAFINVNAISSEILARLRTAADIILRFIKRNNIYTIECTKSTNGATFLPKVLQIKSSLPMIEFVE